MKPDWLFAVLGAAALSAHSSGRRWRAIAVSPHAPKPFEAQFPAPEFKPCDCNGECVQGGRCKNLPPL